MRYKALFAQNDKNCGAKNILFGQIGEEMGIGLEAAVIGDKYRDLFSTYKTKKALATDRVTDLLIGNISMSSTKL